MLKKKKKNWNLLQSVNISSIFMIFPSMESYKIPWYFTGFPCQWTLEKSHPVWFIALHLIKAQLSVSKLIVERRWEGEEQWEYKWKEGWD